MFLCAHVPSILIVKFLFLLATLYCTKAELIDLKESKSRKEGGKRNSISICITLVPKIDSPCVYH